VAIFVVANASYAMPSSVVPLRIVRSISHFIPTLPEYFFCLFQVDRFSVECTSRTSDLLDKKGEWRPAKDRFYDHEAEARDKKIEEDSQKSKQRQQ